MFRFNPLLVTSTLNNESSSGQENNVANFLGSCPVKWDIYCKLKKKKFILFILKQRRVF